MRPFRPASHMLADLTNIPRKKNSMEQNPVEKTIAKYPTRNKATVEVIFRDDPESPGNLYVWTCHGCSTSKSTCSPAFAREDASDHSQRCLSMAL